MQAGQADTHRVDILPRGRSDAPALARANVDAAPLNKLIAPMDAAERHIIRDLCARDLDAARRGVWLALRRWDRPALDRHLHVLSSIAQTVGAESLAFESAHMQARIRSYDTAGHDSVARRIDSLARHATDVLTRTSDG